MIRHRRNYLKLNWDLSTENMQEGQRPEVKSSTRMRCFFLLIHFRGTIWIGVHFTFAFITESVSYCRVRIVHSDAICFNRSRLLRNQIWSLRRTVRRNDLMNQNFQFTQRMITCFGFFHEERESKKWGRLIHCVTPWEIFWKKSDIFPWLSIMGTYDPELKNGNKQKLRYVWRLKTFV